MPDSKYIVTPDNCTGCGLCSNVCSRNAISMEWNADGFLEPTVDTQVCINCGLCVKKCPALHPPQHGADDMEQVLSYGGWNRDPETQILSSSGGVFSALAASVLKEGGIVYGVAWRDKITAEFQKAETLDELKPMRGSKYTGAHPGKVYQQAKSELNKGRKVLFAGTSCQVYALHQYLAKDYSNLITVDILCHGVPSHLLLEKYVQEAEQATGKQVSHVSFRDKAYGWENYHIRTVYTDGTSTICPLKKDYFMRTFLSDKVLNRACYNCMFKHLPRVADITLGDYWGVAKREPEWPVNKGISSVLANSEKGESFLQSLSDTAELKREPFREIFKGQPSTYILSLQTQIPDDREQYLNLLRNAPLAKIYSKLLYALDLGIVRISYRSGLYKLYKNLFKRRK